MNNYKVKLLSEARLELRDIATYHKIKIGANSARRLTNHILDAIEKLSNFPEMGMVPPVKMIAEAGYRMLVVEDYICFYYVVGHSIFVSHIVHGSVDYIKQLF